MRILFSADIHNDELSLDRIIEKSREMDLTVICGDVTGNNFSFAQKAIEEIQNGLFIPGNNESKEIIDLFGEKNIHEKRMELENGYSLVGFGYSPPTPFGTPGEFPEIELYSGMKNLPIDDKTIFAVHAPPYGYFDDVRDGHAGSSAVLEIIKEKQPALCVCGHIHEHKGIAEIRNTKILKVPAAHFLEAGLVEISNELKISFLNL